MGGFEPMAAGIEKRAVSAGRADGSSVRLLSSESARRIAEESGVSLRDVEKTALSSGVIPERYVRNFDSLCLDDQKRLMDATVAVVGLGGLGGCVCELLARAGIGHLILIDGDRFEDSNLNRQLLATMDTIGKAKTQVAYDRLQAVNPAVEAILRNGYLSAATATGWLAGASVVVDCLDNLKDRFLLERAAKALEVPMVSAALAGGFGQLMTIYPEDEGLSLVYGPVDTAPEKGAEVHLGTLGFTAALMASLECAEVIKILTGKGEVVRNRLLVMDLWNSRLDILPLQSDVRYGEGGTSCHEDRCPSES
ncbi:MAG: HesA/MoeB/ThiF family protein [Thermodesulfobacteriota bacterium]